MSDPRSIPSLDELAADPEKVDALPVDVVKRLLVKHATVGAALSGRLLGVAEREPYTNGPDRFLDAEHVGTMIGKSRSWVEHHLKELPPRRKVGGEGVWSEREIQIWMRHREPWK